MISPLSFKGRIGRLPYALWSLGAFFSQHIMLAIVAGRFPSLDDPWAYAVPLVPLVTLRGASDILQMAGLVYLLLVVWALAGLAYRRAVDANVGAWTAASAIAPVIQIPVILFLSVVPSRAGPDRPVAATTANMPNPLWGAAAGVLAGTILTVFAVALGTLVFGVYGVGLFLLAPFAIGVVTAYLANHRGDIGGWRTTLSVLIAIGLGSLALVLFALEGIICIIMAAPLGAGLALLGGAVGRDIALRSRRPAGRTLSCVALLPLVFAVEKFLPPTTSF